jgi:hypothetical protein
MFKQNIRKKKRSKTKVNAIVAARIATEKTLIKKDALNLRQ